MTERVSFLDALRQRWHETRSMLCVGLDPDPDRMPAHLPRTADGIAQFCRHIVDATAEHVVAFKPQIAYFAALGAERALEQVITHIHQNHPHIPVILDAKRGDIGPTAHQYALEAFERYRADALTLSPFMGSDSIDPYRAWPGKGLFLLCRTSNPGGSDLQALAVRPDSSDRDSTAPNSTAPDSPAHDSTAPEAQTLPLYEHVARLAAGPWNPQGTLGLVVGATFPEQLARVRAIAPRLPLLVPGIGAQGGDIDQTVRAGLDHTGYGLILTSSRAILYASTGPAFDTAAGHAAAATCSAIRSARERALEHNLTL